MAGPEGAQTIYATVDDRGGIKESLENNNTFKRTVNIAGVPPDTDGDGMSDLDEATAGTDLQSPQPLPGFSRSNCSNRGASN